MMTSLNVRWLETKTHKKQESEKQVKETENKSKLKKKVWNLVVLS